MFGCSSSSSSLAATAAAAAAAAEGRQATIICNKGEFKKLLAGTPLLRLQLEAV
jgi:hypothetical protein